MTKRRRIFGVDTNGDQWFLERGYGPDNSIFTVHDCTDKCTHKRVSKSKWRFVSFEEFKISEESGFWMWPDSQATFKDA